MKVAIVDYGMGNLHSVSKSVQAAQVLSNQSTKIYPISRPEEVMAADKVIFPGQGAMPDCMSALKAGGLGEAISDGLKSKPSFEICVGAQLLFEHSEEGDTDGLGWFEDQVKRFLPNQTDAWGSCLKVPRMGWNTVRQTRQHPLFQGIGQNEYFYFVHNYYFAPKNGEIILGVSKYPNEFAYVVGKDNVSATQFHTEKSHQAELLLLRNFLNWQIWGFQHESAKNH